MSSEEFKQFDERYVEFLKAYEESYVATLSSVDALQIQRSAINSKKIDPAIAGGLVNGIAGAGAGVYTAVNAAARNSEIDRLRAESKLNASMATSNAESARAYMKQKCNLVIVKMRKYEDLYSLYNELLYKAVKEKEEKPKAGEMSQTQIIIAIIIAIILFGPILFFG